MTALHAPHCSIQVQDQKEKFLIDLFDTLWQRYRGRMEYVRKYEEMILKYGAKFRNDHIAFRTIALEKPALGIFCISRIFEALGYRPIACYEFPDKSLSSIHFEHANLEFPKLFITELKSWELSLPSQKIIQKVLKNHDRIFSDENIRALAHLIQISDEERKRLLRLCSKYFEKLPWGLPNKEQVLTLNQETQYGAWVLVNGYDVNHFTALVNSHEVPALDDIEKVVAEMRNCGIPMKKEIEGERGTKLRQSSTESVVIDAKVREGSKIVALPWSYAYFEIAERPFFKNPVTEKMERFEGFLGAQATKLFDMTKL